MHTFWIGVPITEKVYQKVQRMKNKNKKKKGGKKKASKKLTLGRDKSSFPSMS